ncbi:MAG TPA: peptide chain release factor 3 [Armatimonadota bacterium]|jgi:peptide chain release factor 3
MALHEIQRRRTFAIISHPDAGKTTLTEKLLLYGGAVQQAGAVKARRSQRASTSDWMELEKKRGISINSTVLQFDYQGYRINLLDTPGHEDFSEDTYRVLTAVDAVVMVLDAAKGVEDRTRKLFEVCKRRRIPIFTFVNKMDRPSMDPLALVDEIEGILKIAACPVNWPLGSGDAFRGVYDRQGKRLHLFERTARGAHRAPVSVVGVDDPAVKSLLGAGGHAHLAEELEMLDAAGEPFDAAAILDGSLTPVFFGSAANNFGVHLLLDGFLKYAPPPQPRSAHPLVVAPDHDQFSGFIFKIQANMDPRHRDRVAFLRVCSGTFTRDMAVTHARTGRRVRLSNSNKLFAQQRETVDVAYPGDIVGLVGHSDFGIGDTLTEDAAIAYDDIPKFAPEHFAWLENGNPSTFKRFRDGLSQLLQERVVQAFTIPSAARSVPLLGAVGPLQFEVVQYRLETEYGAESRMEIAPWKLMRWLPPATDVSLLTRATLPIGTSVAMDADDRPILLLASDWALRCFTTDHPDIPLSDTLLGG